MGWNNSRRNNWSFFIEGISNGPAYSDLLIQERLQQLWKSITENGVIVTGYTVWSFLNNFEWNKGYTVKYGLNAVNFDDPPETFFCDV
ncbi:uncharacterized protein LOC130446329 [Diorhabda sublineata]|uniref:uncharacterized protein LOC130446329 n=1 Tax=Diorhabda sublineata TaxID=1163346 RepID=UPI0024E13A69|nr:uncharacterized protein LOC130446329 [Diorhabda sublineata]